eukprot:SAG11_NODE_946_length_6417_cov_2.052865_4_plen_239_part_00
MNYLVKCQENHAIEQIGVDKWVWIASLSMCTPADNPAPARHAPAVRCGPRLSGRSACGSADVGLRTLWAVLPLHAPHLLDWVLCAPWLLICGYKYWSVHRIHKLHRTFTALNGFAGGEDEKRSTLASWAAEEAGRGVQAHPDDGFHAHGPASAWEGKKRRCGCFQCSLRQNLAGFSVANDSAQFISTLMFSAFLLDRAWMCTQPSPAHARPVPRARPPWVDLPTVGPFSSNPPNAPRG